MTDGALQGKGHRRPLHWVWGVPFAPLTLGEATEAVGDLIEAGESSFFITANLNYAMLTACHADLREINDGAAFILADGMPLVWASRWGGRPLPERVAGSDLIFELCDQAARRGHGVFLLGGAPGVGEQAARCLVDRYPGLRIVGVEAPFVDRMTVEDDAALAARIRDVRPDILFVALGQPKGERWLWQRFRTLGVPVCAQVGASLDFAAGRVQRAPARIQRMGLEWAYRLALEPRRLGRRYLSNAWFFARMAARDLTEATTRRARGVPAAHDRAGSRG